MDELYLDELIEQFNNGDTDIIDYFGDYQTFFDVLRRFNKFEELDPKNGVDSHLWQNEFLLFILRNNKEKFHHWCKELLGDIEIEGNKVYLLTDAEDLASLFCNNRDYGRDTIEKIISGDYDHNWYYSYDIDIYDEVIDELDNKNLAYLKQKVINELSNIEIDTGTEELELIATEENKETYVKISPLNIERIFSDSETIMYILDEYMEDTKWELKNLYHRAEESALYDEYYEEVWGELTSEFFDGKPEWFQKQRGGHYVDGKWTPKFIEAIKIEISDFEGVISDYLEANKKYNDGSLENIGSFLSILKEDFECLRVRFPDYADSSKIDKNINEMFGDYI
jgi:hypothetical protein